MMETAFRQWRERHKLTQSQAAKILGISVSYIASYDQGVSRTTGKPIMPNKAVRKLMTAYTQDKLEFEPYPL